MKKEEGLWTLFTGVGITLNAIAQLVVGVQCEHGAITWSVGIGVFFIVFGIIMDKYGD